MSEHPKQPERPQQPQPPVIDADAEPQNRDWLRRLAQAQGTQGAQDDDDDGEPTVLDTLRALKRRQHDRQSPEQSPAQRDPTDK